MLGETSSGSQVVDGTRIPTAALRGGRLSTRRAAGLFTLLVAALLLALPAAGEAAGTASIAGTVTSQAEGTPLEGVRVCVEGLGMSEEVEIPCVKTAANGTYTVASLSAGRYVVEFLPPEGRNLVPQFYDGRLSWEEATPISLNAGEAKTGVDAALEKGATISGFVTAAATGLPVPGVFVCAFSTNGPGAGCAETNGVGGYTIVGLPAGLYEVEFEPVETEQDVVSESYAGGLVPVPAQGQVTGINAALQRGGQIAGTVRAAANGAPLGGVEVCITEAGESWALGCLATPPSGAYRFTHVWAGEFKIVFSPEPSELENGKSKKIPVDSYPTQWWNGQSTFLAATPIGITPPAVVTGIDGSLGPGPTVSPPAPAPTPPVTAIVQPKPKPKPKPLNCHRGLAKKKVKGKLRCVRRHKPRHQTGKHHPKPRGHSH